MKRSLILFFALSCITLFPTNAFSQVVLPWQKKKAQEEAQKAKTEAEIDSLKMVIEEYKARLDMVSEAEDELVDMYYENQDKLGADLKPEDYNADVSDSLLSIWYLHSRTNDNHEGESYDMDNVHFTSNVSDEVFKQRLAKMNSYITLPYNETVRNNMILYSEKMPTKMQQMLGLAQYYMPIFEATLSKYGLPEELKYMAVIESALNPKAYSRAGAAGMWQFMHTTGKLYGLQINSYVDERYDVEKAADAAARYLQDAYGIFGDWNLAISSYNCGAGNVNKAIRRSGSRDFWSIYDYLPRETRGYVPAFVGAMYAFKYYKEYGLKPEPCNLPEHVDTFHINKMVHFQQISEVVGVPMETLHNLNPQYTHDIIPGNEQTYILKLPYNYTASFIEHEDSIYTYKAKEIFSPVVLDNIKNYGTTTSTDRITYKVKSGDYLGRIASRYHVSVADIKKWNHLRSNSIKIGQRLTIYQTVKKPITEAPKATAADSTSVTTQPADSTVTSASDSTAAVSSTAPNVAETQKQVEEKQSEPVIYVVKKGDTLFKISQQYPGVSVQDIMNANNVTANIHPGDKLTIPQK